MAKKVRVIRASGDKSWYSENVGEVFEVKEALAYNTKYELLDGIHLIDVEDAEILNSPKRHEIDGVLYEEVERRAEVGDKIIAVSDGSNYYKLGGVALTARRYEDGVLANFNNFGNKSVRGDGKWFISDRRYRVLSPITPAAPESDADIIANLTRRVFALERDNRKLHAALEDSFHIVLDVIGRRDKRIDEVDAKAEMLIDDVADLDERTQSLVKKPLTPELERIKAEILEAMQ